VRHFSQAKASTQKKEMEKKRRNIMETEAEEVLKWMQRVLLSD
jgi:hypothetical protein